MFLVGETGTGKELFAQAIHDNSARANGPFLPVNCSAITETLFESAMFGHVKGAFTGAFKGQPGFLEAATGGTLFFDEIGDMSLLNQTKMLRALGEEGQYSAVGSTAVKKIEPRIIAATNQDLREGIKKGMFREDLYYRLETLVIKLPPLRERKEDITLLIEYFLSKFQSNLHFSEEASEVLYRYPWPGNVRELQNLVRRLVAMYPDDGMEVTPRDLNLAAVDGESSSLQFLLAKELYEDAKAGFAISLASISKDIAREVVRLCDGNKAKAGRILGLVPKTLLRWLREQDSEGN